MANPDPIRALPRPSHVADKKTEISAVMKAFDRVSSLRHKLSRELRSAALRVAQEIADQEAEQLDVDRFLHTWKAVAERFQERESLLQSFSALLEQCLESYKEEYAAELLGVLEEQHHKWERIRQEKERETEAIDREMLMIAATIDAMNLAPQTQAPALQEAPPAVATPPRAHGLPSGDIV